jgi:FlaA1/EpsC-like NDP-sugar epimerase
LFKKQIAKGGPITLTDTRMTRFIMTLEEAVRLVMESVFLACGGEVFVTKMPVVRIQDIAEVMIEELAPKFGYECGDIRIDVIGSKPGEKLYEELMNDEETRRTIELTDYFSVLPAFKAVYESIDYAYGGSDEAGIDEPYNSSVQRSMDKESVRNYLLDNGLLGEET